VLPAPTLRSNAQLSGLSQWLPLALTTVQSLGMRLLARATRASTSSCVGVGAGWNICPLPSPSGEYTPSRKMV